MSNHSKHTTEHTTENTRDLSEKITMRFSPVDFDRLLALRLKLHHFTTISEIPNTVRAEIFDQYQLLTDVLNHCGAPDIPVEADPVLVNAG